MSKGDARNSAFEQLRPSLERFLDRVAKTLYPMVTQFLSERKLSPEQLVEEDVEERQSDLLNTIAKWEEFKTLRDLHDKVPILKRRIESLDKYRTESFGFEQLLLSGAGRYVFHLVRGALKDEAAKEAIAGYAALVRGDRCGSVIGATFRALELMQEPLNLDSETVVRRLTHEERRFTYRRGFLDHDRDREEIPGLPSLLISRVARPLKTYLHAFPTLTDEVLQDIRPSVAFVQLFVSNELRPNALFVFNTRWLPNPTGTIRRLSDHVDPYPEPQDSMAWLSEKKYSVDAAQESRLKGAWPSYRSAMSDRRFARACSRYSLALHRESDEDRIIDHWVGLEALFGKGSEIAATVALKLAILLETEIRRRKICRQWVTAHYGVRSAIVHGGDLESALKRLAKLVGKDLQHAIPAVPRTACILSGGWLERSLIRLAEDFASLAELDDVLLHGFLARDRPKPHPLALLLADAGAKGKDKAAAPPTAATAERAVEAPSEDRADSP